MTEVAAGSEAVGDGRVELGERLKAIRLLRRQTLKDVAEAAGVSESFVSQVERGRSSASVATLQRLAAALGIEISDLFATDGLPRPRVLRREARQLLVWALTNTSSLSGSPALSLSNSEVNVGRYTLPPSSTQKAGSQPLRECLNSSSCSQFLEGVKDPFAEKSANLDSNDTRMQQVTWVNGQLWGAIDTGLSVSSNKQAGIEWFKVAPSTSTGTVTAALSNQGYLGLGNDNLTYPAIGLTSSGTGVMAFTVVGSDFYPSAGYAMIGAGGVGDVHIAASGQGPDDGFSDYRLFANPPSFTARPRWGDYGAAVALGNNVWIASEYIGQSCSLAEYLKTNFRCGSTRTALANWDTRISEVAAP